MYSQIPKPDTALLALLAEIEQAQTLPRHVIEQNQARQLSALFAHHAKFSSHFASRLSASGHAGAAGRDTLRLLAPLTRSAIQSAGRNLFAREVPATHLPIGITQTSGSTGEPVKIAKTAVNRRMWQANTIRDHLWNHRNFQGKLASIRAHNSKLATRKDWGAPVTMIYQTGPALGIPITTDLRQQLELLASFSPEILLIYPSNLTALVTIWEREGFDLPQIRHFKTIGETVSLDLRQRLRALNGCAIEDSYTSQEVGSIALQCSEGQYHVMSESVIVEVLDEQDQPCPQGAIGRVVVTDLLNYATPMIRYSIGDYAEVGGPCTCGRQSPTLRRILGRRRNLLVKPDGSSHWPLVGFARFNDVADVRQYQFIQHSVAEIEFKVVPGRSLTAAEKLALIGIASAALGGEFTIRLTVSDTRLPVGANGKLEEFLSKIT
jgi:phenylacetate-CoA ligase